MKTILAVGAISLAVAAICWQSLAGESDAERRSPESVDAYRAMESESNEDGSSDHFAGDPDGDIGHLIPLEEHAMRHGVVAANFIDPEWQPAGSEGPTREAKGRGTVRAEDSTGARADRMDPYLRKMMEQDGAGLMIVKETPKVSSLIPPSCERKDPDETFQ